MEDIVWFKDVGREDVDRVGGKGANLGELSKFEIPVPNGFIVTAQAYFYNLIQSGAQDRIRGILYSLDVNNPLQLEQKAKECQKIIKEITLDPKLENNLYKFYKKLSGDHDQLVAVRSSATAEDLPQASFAGQQSTFLNIKGNKDLKKAVLDVWASLFEARAIFYRSEQKFDNFKVGIAIPVQRMVESETSGIMFTIDPLTNDKSKIIIEAVFGLGELIVSGQTTPDHYEVDKKTFTIISKKIAKQEKQLVNTKNGNKLVSISKFYQNAQKLSDEKIIELAKLGHKIENHYFFPQDIEWAYEKNKIYIVQTRPITTIKIVESQKQKSTNAISTNTISTNTKVLVEGAPASPIIGTGKVVIIKNVSEINRVQKGDVLVTQMTNPDFVPAMKKAIAIVTDRGDRTSHAAIVSRELGIACVVGIENATKNLKEGMIVTVDGSRGVVYQGQSIHSQKILDHSGAEEKYHKTATKIYVNLAEPEIASKIAAKNVDGVGLLSAEFILAQIGKHPKQFIAEGKQKDFVKDLSEGLNMFGRAFGSRPVIYRATDFKSNEYRDLEGGDKFEPKESNPKLGYRGAFRYVKDPDVFKLELEALKISRTKHSNIHLMIPFVRNVQELIDVKRMVTASGLFADDSFKFFMMVEIPSNVILLEEYIKVSIDGVSIGSNDLTMLILGTDRDNEEVAGEFKEMDPAVLWALERIVKTSVKHNIKVSICGQAPSIYPELAQKLVSWGISSISVNPDVIDSTRQNVYEAEKKILKINK